ncbi:hypothetical protein BKA58DRAFT_9102 [Alternaria rosae]|uniref:uncharacterized protein n=1 Tax=Alternaria rosae TaxID=1187941 RepID=UPI001E8EAA86|nr:uncharacterized protein BKA58DRAFT_9102 [Alternaria rosae]KAH6881843.1 hypothetical protein BKA58DRAFT_9102 [Alternaria rosae]
MHKSAVRRSACDQCRAKRVRCLRAQDSTAACARCCYMGAQCVTGAAGLPGRPPKQRHAVAVASPRAQRTPTLRDVNRDNSHATAISMVPVPTKAYDPAMQLPSPRDPVAQEPLPDLWGATGDISAFLDSYPSSMDQSPMSCEDSASLADQLGTPSQLQGLPGAHDEFDMMLHMSGVSGTALDLNLGSLLDCGEEIMDPAPLPQFSSAASSLVMFREEIDQRIATIDTYYSNAAKVQQRCKDEAAGRDVENPAALLLTCTKEFTGIIQNLTPAGQMHMQTEDTLNTETLLLVLSSYLALMRLFDSLFQRIHKYLCQVSPESYKTIKVKSVLRIGGVSALQDMPLKAYAIGILDAIQGQVQTLECCMGIPAEYCLSGDAVASSTAAASGIFSSAQRLRLFWTVMAQEDVKSLHGSSSYVESIRASIKESMTFLDD